MLIRRISQSGSSSRAVFHFDPSAPDIVGREGPRRLRPSAFQSPQESSHRETRRLRDFVVFTKILTVLNVLHFSKHQAYSCWRDGRVMPVLADGTPHTSAFPGRRNPLVGSPSRPQRRVGTLGAGSPLPCTSGWGSPPLPRRGLSVDAACVPGSEQQGKTGPVPTERATEVDTLATGLLRWAERGPTSGSVGVWGGHVPQSVGCKGGRLSVHEGQVAGRSSRDWA